MTQTTRLDADFDLSFTDLRRFTGVRRAARRRAGPAAAAVDADLVRRLIAEQFPRYRKLPVAAVVPGGHDNRTFRVGGSLCARLPSAGRYAPHLLVEYEGLPRLARHLPLPIPQPAAVNGKGRRRRGRRRRGS